MSISPVGLHHQPSRPLRGPSSPNPGIPRLYPRAGQTLTARLVAGEYEMTDVQKAEDGSLVVVRTPVPFLRYTRHYDFEHKESAQCSAGVYAAFKELRDLCAGCDLYWNTLERRSPGRAWSSRMLRSTQSAFTAIHLAPFHPPPRDAPNVLVECTGAGCRGCVARAPTTPGQPKMLDLGWRDFQALCAADVDIGKACATCGSAGLETLAWVCQGCGDAAIDLRAGVPKPAKLHALLRAPFPCACGRTALLQEIIRCRACTSKGQDARRATLFDVNLELTGEPVGERTVLKVTRWSAPRNLESAIAPLAVPLDLPTELAPTPYAVQCARFRLQPPPGRTPAR